MKNYNALSTKCVLNLKFRNSSIEKAITDFIAGHSCADSSLKLARLHSFRRQLAILHPATDPSLYYGTNSTASTQQVFHTVGWECVINAFHSWPFHAKEWALTILKEMHVRVFTNDHDIRELPILTRDLKYLCPGGWFILYLNVCLRFIYISKIVRSKQGGTPSNCI